MVLQHARRLVQGAAQLNNEVLQMTKLDAGELHFGSGPALAARLVPEALRQFIERHPGIRTALLVDNAERLGQALRREQIEFFVDDIRPFEADPNFHTEALNPRPGLFFCRPGHPLLAKDSLSTNDLFAYPLASALLAQVCASAWPTLAGAATSPRTCRPNTWPYCAAWCWPATPSAAPARKQWPTTWPAVPWCACTGATCRRGWRC